MDEEFKTLKAIEKLIGQPIKRDQLEGFADVELNGKTPPPKKTQRPPRKPKPGGARGRNNNRKSG
jgi:ATP-dependent RNA helicase RhlE